MIGGLRVPQFLAKQEKQNRPALNDAAIDTVMDSSLQIRGTDTPPEKCHVRFCRRRPRKTTTEEVLPKEVIYEGRGEHSSLPWAVQNSSESTQKDSLTGQNSVSFSECQVLHVYGLLELQSVIVEIIRIFCTLYIECTETALVLQNATQDTLAILDELSLDGYAIAYVVRFC
ncbi:hypothetical protein SO802_012288 [Lithocarpus litseifolius]|uniref:Uncharacterized protein n=1 Tax=Lithocarpus litseifolius TaxID=425828 RepID=A0AAW2D4H3_9ROSI